MSDVTETRWFKIVTFVFVGICVAFFAFSFATARSLVKAQQKGIAPLDSGDVDFYWWTSLILLILSIIIFIWLGWRLIFARTFRVNITDTVYEYGTATEGGFLTSDAVVKPAAVGKSVARKPVGSAYA